MDLNDGYNRLTPKQIHRSIRVSIDDHGISPGSVYFTWYQSLASSHMKWQCFDYITGWLKAADVEFTVDVFQENLCIIDVYCPETKLMLKLMFDRMDLPTANV